MTIACRLVTLIIGCLVVVSSGSCKRAETRQIRIVSGQEAADLWDRAQTREPVGQAITRTFREEGGVLTVVTSQTYMLRMAGGETGGTVSSCSASCILNPGATFDDCKTSGCLSTGKTCTPVVCSGGCRVSRSCQATFDYGFSFAMQ